MPNPPSHDRRGKAQQNIEARYSILAPKTPEAQALQTQSPELTQQRSLVSYPSLPSHLNQLIDQPWNRENSLKLDQWLWYCQQEFEVVGGWQ